MNLAEWFKIRTQLPLKLILSAMCLLWVCFVVRESLNRNEEVKGHLIDLERHLLLAMAQNNRPFVEHILENAHRQLNAKATTLCLGDRTLVEINATSTLCAVPPTVSPRQIDFTKDNPFKILNAYLTIYSKKLSGSNELKIVMQIDRLAYLRGSIGILLLILLFVFFVFQMLHKLERSLLKDVIYPLQNILDAKQKIEIKEIEDIKTQISMVLAAEQKALQAQTLIALSKQVAHDIRSPLSAVNMILPSLQGNQPEQTQILRTALKRINDIAQDLLDRKNMQLRETTQNQDGSMFQCNSDSINKTPMKSKTIGVESDANYFTSSPHQAIITNVSPSSNEPITSCDVVLVVRQIVLEKNVQIQKPDIQITIDADGESVFAQTNAKELSRILSNLLNNSIEAKDPERGLEIQIFIRQYNKQVSIVVMDNGVGIPSDKIALLGQVGVSFGKDQKSDFASHADNEKNVGSDLKHKSGTGLGLAHAKQALESWGGHLKIQSSVGIGTQMHLQLPGFEFRKH